MRPQCERRWCPKIDVPLYSLQSSLSVPGAQIIGPLRGSIRGIVGYVETTVENFDLLIDLEKQRSFSSPERSIHHV